MERRCETCRGEGGHFFYPKKKRHIPQLSDEEGEWVDCRDCQGTGVNPRYRETTCSKCQKPVGYDVKDDFPPPYCSTCLVTIEAERQYVRNFHHNLHSVDVIPPKQRDALAQGPLLEKPCTGLKGESGCIHHNMVQYYANQPRVADLCPDCYARLKVRLEANRQNKHSKPCPRCGGIIIYYNIDFKYCRSCNKKRVLIYRINSRLNFVYKEDEMVFSFGKCFLPQPSRQDETAYLYRQWTSKGYYWAKLPDNQNVCYIFEHAPAEKGFLTLGEADPLIFTPEVLRPIFAEHAVHVLENA